MTFGESFAFRGAERAHGYLENTEIVTPAGVRRVAGETEAEQRLAAFQASAHEERNPTPRGQIGATTPPGPGQVVPGHNDTWSGVGVTESPGPAGLASHPVPPEPPARPGHTRSPAVPFLADLDLRAERRDVVGSADVERTPHGWRGVLRNMGLTVKPSAAEIRAAELGSARSLIRLSRWPRSVGVLVANPKGGVGKTPLSLAIGGCFASIRGGGVVVVEVSDDPGALSVRAEGRATVGLAELLRDLEEVRGAGNLAGYVLQQTSYAAVIGTVGDRAPLSGTDVHRITRKLDEFYPVRVMDSGNQLSSSAFRGALDFTDVLVIPVLDALDAFQGAMQLLRHLHQLGGRSAQLARNAIIVRTHDGRPEDREISAYADGLIQQAGITAVCHLPIDHHIAERAALSYGQLAPATTDAITRLTAGIVDHLNTSIRKEH